MKEHMRPTDFARRLALAVGLVSTSAAHGADLSGRVVGVGDGRGIAQAMVTLSFPDGHRGPAAITVFSGADGSFRIPSHNIAAEVPASAWFAGMPAGDERNITITSCSSCHQMASPRVREYAAKIEAVSNGPEGDKKAVEEWRKVVRHEAWRTIVKYMRSKHYSVFPLESPVNLDAIDWTAAQNADYNFFNARQGELIADYLAKHFPKQTVFMARDDYAYGAALGVSEKTVIREYSFPKDALVRELVPAPGSPYLWGADVRRNFVVRLDPANGETKWYAPDFKGSTGPHTIAPDDDGNLWVSMIDNDQFGRFDPETEKWKLWTLRPTNLPDTASMAGGAIVHDFSIDSKGHMARPRTASAPRPARSTSSFRSRKA